MAFSWLAMQAVHELGHVVHAWTSGGRVERVVLHPLEISRTDVTPNAHPQFVAWGGPVWGSLIPLGIHVVLLRCQWSRAWLSAFFAGFCLVANGAYLLGGSLYPVGDAQTLLDNGTPRWTLAIFGIAGLASGLALWHGLGKHFGFGQPVAPADKGAVWGMSACAVILLIAELLWVII
jgi:Peptidase M50B-like